MLLQSLSARLLVLTIFFVMLGEVLIFVPSVARFRMTYFGNHLAAGHIEELSEFRAEVEELLEIDRRKDLQGGAEKRAEKRNTSDP